MNDPRDSFVAAIDLSNARVETFPGLIFFCGGPFNPSGPPRSLRDYFLRWLQANDADTARRVVIAEHINDWMKEETYAELFTLEQHLAALASTIVIFLESPGAIAELGAFSALAGVQEKLLVFVQQSHYQSDSFIRLGPINFLAKRFADSIAVYPWETTLDEMGERIIEPSADECVLEMHKDLHGAAGRVARSVTIIDDRDRMLLVADLIGYMVALKSGEIGKYLESLGISLSAGELKKYLFVLEKLGLVRAVIRGHSRYYIASEGQTYLQLAARDGYGPFDRLRINFEVSTYYKDHDSTRSKAVAKALAELA